MEQQQEITYQYDLFNQAVEDVMRPFDVSDAVSGVLSTKALQVKEAGEQGRALAHNLMGAILCYSNICQAYKQVKLQQRSCWNRPNAVLQICLMVCR